MNERILALAMAYGRPDVSQLVTEKLRRQRRYSGLTRARGRRKQGTRSKPLAAYPDLRPARIPTQRGHGEPAHPGASRLTSNYSHPICAAAGVKALIRRAAQIRLV